MRSFLAACVLACLCAVSTPASAQRVTTVDPQIAALLVQFPAGGPGLRAAIARALEANPGLADAAVAAARNANPEQKQAIGAGIGDAANYFAKIGQDWARGSEARIRTSMVDADSGTRIGFELASVPALAQGIPGFNNAGASSSGCVTGASPISQSRPAPPGC